MKKYAWWLVILLIAMTESGFMFFLSPTQGLFSPVGLVLLFLILELSSVLFTQMNWYKKYAKQGIIYPAILGFVAFCLLEMGSTEAATGLTIWVLLASTVIFFVLPKIIHPKYLK